MPTSFRRIVRRVECGKRRLPVLKFIQILPLAGADAGAAIDPPGALHPDLGR